MNRAGLAEAPAEVRVYSGPEPPFVQGTSTNVMSSRERWHQELRLQAWADFPVEDTVGACLSLWKPLAAWTANPWCMVTLPWVHPPPWAGTVSPYFNIFELVLDDCMYLD